MSAASWGSTKPINTYLFEMVSILVRIREASIEENIALLYDAWSQRRQVFIIGNGGSAATASHMANDLSKGAIVPGKPRIKAIALTDNVSLISAWANDTCYENIFKEQLENLFDEMDVVIGISASGNSPNILRAVEFAKQQGLVTIGWTGRSGGRLKDMVDLAVQAPTDDVGMIESCHMILDHLITTELRRRIHEGDAERARERSETLQTMTFVKREEILQLATAKHEVVHPHESLNESTDIPAMESGSITNRR